MTSAAASSGGARDRILETAYLLFSRHGVQSVGIDRIIAESEVAKMTLYRHFPTKQDLVLAFLDLRAQRWTRGWLEAEVERLARHPDERGLIVFDVLDEWFHRRDYEGCSFINTLLEIEDRTNPIHRAAVRHLNAIRRVLEGWVEPTGASDVAATAGQLQIVMMGAIVSARRGERNAARHAKPLAELILDTG